MVRGMGGAAVGVLVLAAAVMTPASGQQEAAATCGGHAVTIRWDDPGVGLRINGTSGPDVIQGGPGNETINAGGGEDYVCAGAGFDLINGGPGRDELFGQDDSDEFTGADLYQDLVTGGSRDSDTAAYRDVPSAVRVDMSTGLTRLISGGTGGGLVGIEVIAGSNFNDTLIGRSSNDVIYGRGGNDTIDGRGGSDDLFGQAGTDRLVYSQAGSAVRIDLNAGTAFVGTVRDDYRDIEDVTGSRFGDQITGDAENNHLVGAGGDDVIKGKNGNDILEGGGGDDMFFPSHGEDFVDGGTNDPVTSTGHHGDMVSYQGDTVDPGETGFSAYLAPSELTNSPPGSEGVGDDEFSGIESVRGVAGKTNILLGDDGPNVLIGGDRTDLVHGRGGNDLIFGLGLSDSLFGDNGPDDPPTPFGDDFIDGGNPNGANDPDHAFGQNGDDTCVHVDTQQSECETFG